MLFALVLWLLERFYGSRPAAAPSWQAARESVLAKAETGCPAGQTSRAGIDHPAPLENLGHPA